MPIDERLRADLPAAVDGVRPDVDSGLAVVLHRAKLRSRVRRAAYSVGLVAAAVVAVVVGAGIIGSGNDDARPPVEPVRPGDQVRLLDQGLGSADEPAPLRPGRYAIPFIGAAENAPWGLVEVPDGWGQDRLLLATGPDLDPHLRRVELFAINQVASDPCASSLQPVEENVTDIAGALTEQHTMRPSGARPVSIDGHAGQLVRFRVPAGLDDENCWDGQSLRPFGHDTNYTSVFPGWTYRVWVLDVDGDPLAILAAHGPQTTPTELAELTGLVEGLTFTEQQ